MKRFFTILCAALMTLSTVNAEVLLNEHFAQTTETLATNDDALPYTGEIAASGWTNIMGGSGNVYVNTTNDLTYSGYKSATDGTGSVEFKASFGRRVASPLSKSVNSGSVYMAGIVKISEVSGSGKDYLWALGVGTSGLNSASSKHYARPYVMASGSGFKFGIAKLNETSTTLTYSDELAFGTYLVVVEYTFVDGTGNDVINMYINPTKGDKPAVASLVPAANTQADASAAFGSVILYSSSSNKAACLIDELKVVTDWADLWAEGGGGGGGEDPTPTINVTSSLVQFGDVNVSVAASKDITVSGKDLTADISVESNNAAVAISADKITKEQALAEGGYVLKLTLTATSAGEGSAKVTLSSTGASNKVISVTWNAVVPPTKIANIAALKATTYEETKFYELESEPIVIRQSLAGTVLQDESGALIATDYLQNPLSSYSVGDKVQIKMAQLYEKASDYVDGFHTIMVINHALISSDNKATPFAVNASNFDSYGPALVKVTDVSISPTGKFAKGVYTISDTYGTGYVQVPEACDIIDVEIPAKADITGLVVRASLKNAIRIDSKDDVKAKSATGIEEVRSENANAVRSEKKIINGQLVIVKDGKMFNVIGVEL